MNNGNVAQAVTPFEGKLDTVLHLLTKIADKLDRQLEGRINSQPMPVPEPKPEIPPVMPIHTPIEYRFLADEILNKRRDEPLF